MTDRSYESGLGSGRPQGVANEQNEYGLGNQAQDTSSSAVQKEEGMGSGRDMQPIRSNEFDLGNERKDPPTSADNEEGLGDGRGAQPNNSGDEFGMGSGRPASEEGMGVIPGHHKKEHKESSGGGLKEKIKDIFHKD